MQLREKKKIRYAIPTASMGDVAFLILIFFLTSTVFTKDKGLALFENEVVIVTALRRGDVLPRAVVEDVAVLEDFHEGGAPVLRGGE